jgi:hypothetical protein
MRRENIRADYETYNSQANKVCCNSFVYLVFFADTQSEFDSLLACALWPFTRPWSLINFPWLNFVDGRRVEGTVALFASRPPEFDFWWSAEREALIRPSPAGEGDRFFAVRWNGGPRAERCFSWLAKLQDRFDPLPEQERRAQDEEHVHRDVPLAEYPSRQIQKEDEGNNPRYGDC